MTKYFFIAFILLVLASCNPTAETSVDAITQVDSAIVPVKTTLSGQVYFYAPEIDTLTCQASGACDCCSGHFIFLNDTDFISMDYCESKTSYCKGSYQFLNGDLLIISDSILIHRQYNPAREANPSAIAGPTYLITDIVAAPYKQTLKKLVCKNSLSFLMGTKETYFVTPDNKTSFKDLLQTIKDEGILDRMGIKN